MSSPPSLRVRPSRSRAVSSVSHDNAASHHPPSFRETEDARARLSRLSSADLRRRDDHSLSRSVSSVAARNDTSPLGSPTKRPRLSLEGEDGPARGRAQHRDVSSQPATISEDPSASLLLANEDSAPDMIAECPAPALKKQRSWSDVYRHVALGEPPAQPPEPEVNAPSKSSKVEAGTQTDSAEALKAAHQPERTSWFSWSRSSSINTDLTTLAGPSDSKPPAVAATTFGSPVSDVATLPLPKPRPPSRRPSLEKPPPMTASPSSTSLRTLIAGRGRATSKTRVTQPSMPRTRDESTQTGLESTPLASVETAPVAPKIEAPGLTAPPIAATSSRSSWWSRGPTTPVLPSTPSLGGEEPAKAAADDAASPAAIQAKAGEPPSAAQAIALAKEKEKEGETPSQPSSSWIPWWGGKPETVSQQVSPVIGALADSEPAAIKAPPLNPIVDTLPDSRSTWSRYFCGKTVPRAAIKGEMEVMEVEFPAPLATPPISPVLQAKDKGSKPSSVRSLTLSEPVKDKPGAKPLTASKKASKAALKPNAPNLVLPTFKDSFERPPRSLPPRQGAIAKALSVVNAYLNSTPSPSSSSSGPSEFSERLPKTLDVMGRQLHIERIRRIVIIGCHGWFPAAIVQSLVGRPTGTSPRFASMMSAAIRDWLITRGVVLGEDAITSIPLEGEGKINDRVERLYSALTARSEWIAALQAADAVFVATHSQGSIVSTHLVDHLIAEGKVKSNAKITMLCMASVSHGPFLYIGQSWSFKPYFDYVEGEAARELFVLQDAESAPSKGYRESMQRILDAGVKMLFVASCDDQVVPLSSGLFHSLSHPGVLRAVFVDSQAFASSDFIVNLVVFAVRLRNAGLSDHDLLPQLSEALAGALTGVGHSRIYDEKMVYDLAVRYAFETTSTLSLPTTSTSLALIPAQYDSFDHRTRRTNPHYLPWTLRGILEEQRVKTLFGEELSELREMFEEWHPVSKALRDIRYQLEPLRSIARKNLVAVVDVPERKNAKL